MSVKFSVNGVNVDYNFLGTFPKSMEKANDEVLLDYFLESYKFTFTNTVFEYYGDIKEVRELIKDNLILDEIDYYKQSNNRKWLILLLVVLKMFYQIHNTMFANKTTDLIVSNIERYTDEQLLKTIHDLNFALYYGIEECLIVTPSKINELKATNDDCFLLSELLNEKNTIIKFLKSKIRKEDVNLESYEHLYKETLKKGFHEVFFDGFVLSWIDMMEAPTEFVTLNLSQWEEFLAEIYAITYTFFGLLLKNENLLYDVTDNLYKAISNIVKIKYNIKFDIPSIVM